MWLLFVINYQLWLCVLLCLDFISIERMCTLLIGVVADKPSRLVAYTLISEIGECASECPNLRGCILSPVIPLLGAWPL